MNDKQLLAVRCALADLIGAYQAYEQSDMHVHDWKAHLLSTDELAEAFGLESELVDDLAATEHGANMTEIETLITSTDQVLAGELRARGHAVTIFDEEELCGVEAKGVEQAMFDAGVEFINFDKEET